MKFRRRMKALQGAITVRMRPLVSDEGRRAELALGLNILADVTWKLVLALSMLEENKYLLETDTSLARLHEIADTLTDEVDILLEPLEAEEFEPDGDV